jgi:hypothetical protein
MNSLWLGYDGLSVPCADVVAVLVYSDALDGLLRRSFGRVPAGVRAVVLTAAGRYLPARIAPEQLRSRWAGWRQSLG